MQQSLAPVSHTFGPGNYYKFPQHPHMGDSFCEVHRCLFCFEVCSVKHAEIALLNCSSCNELYGHMHCIIKRTSPRQRVLLQSGGMCHPPVICPRVVEGIAREDMFPENDSNKTLLSKMIYNGKIMYFMDQVLPDAPDTLKIGYTDAQLKWCQQFESKIWAWFIDQDLLYESDYQKIQKYLSVAPY